MGTVCPLIEFDHVELYVGNAKQAAYVYQHQFGFTPIAYRGLETGDRNVASYLLQQGDIRIILSSPLGPDTPIATHILRHGDGVGVLAFTVHDVLATYRDVVHRGATPVTPPKTIREETHTFRYAVIQGYGDTLIKFVDRPQHGDGEDGRGQGNRLYFPGFQPMSTGANRHPLPPTGLQTIDHIVGNVAMGRMEPWADFFIHVLGFDLLLQFDENTITTQHSALRSKVVQDPSGRIKLPINEPGRGQRASQIAEFLQYYGGAGVQHIALSTANILNTVSRLKANGVQFLQPPPRYYQTLTSRVGTIRQPIELLAKLGILVDRDRDGYLLQIFTHPLHDRPTLFFEIIERHGAKGFGEGNFKALFEAIEQEQERRGNLV